MLEQPNKHTLAAQLPPREVVVRCIIIALYSDIKPDTLNTLRSDYHESTMLCLTLI